MNKVIQLPVRLVQAEADYHRPPLAWITRRARRIERFFGVSRRVAVAEAAENYFQFTRMHRARVLKLIQGGQVYV